MKRPYAAKAATTNWEQILEQLVHLSLVAHDQAIMRGGLSPAERPEWMHLPMKMVRNIPVFDASRMREDQIEEVLIVLNRIVDKAKIKYGSLRDEVEQYMRIHGVSGSRLQDIIESTGASKPILLKYLREMVDAGTVKVEEEETRGKKASRRKRYFLVAERNLPSVTAADQVFMQGTDLQPQMLGLDKNEASGIIHHGTWTHSVVCHCSRCRWAFKEACIADEVSAARKRGETGLKEMMAQA